MLSSATRTCCNSQNLGWINGHTSCASFLVHVSIYCTFIHSILYYHPDSIFYSTLYYSNYSACCVSRPSLSLLIIYKQFHSFIHSNETNGPLTPRNNTSHNRFSPWQCGTGNSYWMEIFGNWSRSPSNSCDMLHSPQTAITDKYLAHDATAEVVMPVSADYDAIHSMTCIKTVGVQDYTTFQRIESNYFTNTLTTRMHKHSVWRLSNNKARTLHANHNNKVCKIFNYKTHHILLQQIHLAF